MQRAKTESDLIERLRRRAALPKGTEIVAGIGDDCAIFRPRGSSEDLLFTTDLLLEDVHFRRATHAPADVGWKALARGLSDIAAMGGEPRFCLLSLALAPWTSARWFDSFSSGLAQSGPPRTRSADRRRSRPCRETGLRYRGVRRGPAGHGPSPRRRPRGRMPSTFPEAWAAPRLAWPADRRARGGAIFAPSRGSRSAVFCAPASTPPPPWI